MFWPQGLEICRFGHAGGYGADSYTWVKGLGFKAFVYGLGFRIYGGLEGLA